MPSLSYDEALGDAVAANNFVCEIDGKAIPVKEVSGLKKAIDMVEVKTQSLKGMYYLKKIPGKPKAVTLTITRALTKDPTFIDWMKSVETGKPDRRDVTIKVYPPGPLEKEQHTYIVKNCQPSSIELTQMAAGATNAIDEKVTLQGEGVEIK